nr:uncharacterized protein K02A2.6-like [Lytechinus pictus]
MGAKEYGLLKSLVVPRRVPELSLDDIDAVLKEHYNPTPPVMLERYRFYKRNQGHDETIAVYLAELKKMAETCDFRVFRSEALRDRFCSSPQDRIENIVANSDVFDNNVGRVKGVQAKLKVRNDVEPKFFKPRPIPFALKDKVAEENDRLVKEGILEPVEFSDWAAPVVPVQKPDGRIMLCGDYKITINPQLEVKEYPMPRPEELFASLQGGKKFTKLDLKKTYQQVDLEEKSRQYVTINTHLGLFRYTRLPFGVSSARAIFQECMNKILHGLRGVGCYLDYIIVTGSNDQEHASNLERVLKRLSQFGLRLKQSKCVFLQESVEYLGHVVDAEGLHPSPSRVEAIASACPPRYVSEEVYTSDRPQTIDLPLGTKERDSCACSITVATLGYFALRIRGEIKYRTSKQNANADFLSRLPSSGKIKSQQDEFVVKWTEEATKTNEAKLKSLPVTSEKIRQASEKDKTLSRVRIFVLNGWPRRDEISLEFDVWLRKKDEMIVESGCLLWGTIKGYYPRVSAAIHLRRTPPRSSRNGEDEESCSDACVLARSGSRY